MPFYLSLWKIISRSVKRILSRFIKPKVTESESKVFRVKVLEVISLFAGECRFEKGYFNGARYRMWLSKAETLLNEHHQLVAGRRSNSALKDALFSLQEFLTASRGKQKEFNDAFMAAEVAAQKDFFEKGQEAPLDGDQRLAVVCDEDHTLVLAGAGSGKTSVIAAKAAYLVKVKKIPEEEILLLTFGEKAAEEMKKRVQKQYGLKRVKAQTIHSLGLRIIGRVEGNIPSVIEEDTAATRNSQLKLLNKVIEGLMKVDRTFRRGMAVFLNEFEAPPKTQWDFKSLKEWEEYIAGFKGFLTLSNDRVKSYEEKVIANHLFRHGVRFEYEKPYKFDTANAENRQYQPDFYLTDYDVYLEHFGIDRLGNPPPFFTDEEKASYLDGMEWKKKLHAEKGTKLVCTYSYMRQEGTLIQNLEDLLEKQGVAIREMPIEFEGLIRNSDIARFVIRVLKAFLALYKQGGHEIEKLRETLQGKQDIASMRSRAFLGIFEPFYTAYEKELDAVRKIDFADMIHRARGYVEKDYSKCGRRLQYIIVDEFQDTAAGAVKLIRAIGAQNPGCKLYFVGDDWQSIYRFNGSDVSLIQKFEENFGDSRVVALGNNYRSFRNVVELGEAFITKNPFQRKKPIRAIQSMSRKNSILFSNRPELIEKFIRNACEWQKIDKGDIFFLGRYNADQPDYLKELSKKFKNLNLSFLTIHKSKGLEAEFVFLLPPKDLQFPSLITDDPILDLVAAPREDYAYAEERRLMYVAITRAKRQVFFVKPDAEARMPFFKEIEEMLKSKKPAYN